VSSHTDVQRGQNTDVVDFFASPAGSMAKKALAAVALHDWERNPHPLADVSFFDNPVAVMLYIVDNLQDWERAHYEDERQIWNYQLTRFENTNSYIRFCCDLQPVYRLGSADPAVVEQKFNLEVENKRKLTHGVARATNKTIGVRVSAEFTLQGVRSSKKAIRYSF
jgi:hypothetical protein